jgi:mycothiol synthase
VRGEVACRAVTPLSPADGLTWRPASLDDADRLADLFTAVDEAEDLEEPLGPDGVRHYLTLPGLDPAADTLVGVTPEGGVAAFAWVWGQETSQAARSLIWAEAHPGHLDLERRLLEWAESRARRRLEAAGPTTRRYLRLHIEEHRRRRRRLLEALGYHHARTFVEMHRSLTTALPPVPPPPPEWAIEPWSAALDEGLRQACNQAFAGHWDSLPLDQEQWQQRVSGDSDFRPDLSRLAVAGGQVGAFCLAAVDPEYNQREGLAEVWLERIGTRPRHQRRGLATALILHSLRAGAAAGFTRAGLGVDQASTSGAGALYEGLGFASSRRTLAYLKELG